MTAKQPGFFCLPKTFVVYRNRACMVRKITHDFNFVLSLKSQQNFEMYSIIITSSLYLSVIQYFSLFIHSVPLLVRILLIISSLIGFIVFDIAYTAVVINYSMQCQLMVYYMQSICTRTIDKEWEIDEAIKVQIKYTKSILIICKIWLPCLKITSISNVFFQFKVILFYFLGSTHCSSVFGQTQ